MALFCPLYSGSSGNCVYLDSGKTKVLIDLGVSCRAAVTALSSLDVDPKDLSAILITHEHSDHIKGLAVFLKKYPVPLFASREVLDFIRENVKLPEDLPLYEADPDGFYVDQMQVSPFPTSHDSVEASATASPFWTNTTTRSRSVSQPTLVSIPRRYSRDSAAVRWSCWSLTTMRA